MGGTGHFRERLEESLSRPGPCSALREGDALIIVPPFTDLYMPALSAHVLQACARAAGFDVSVLYAGIALASIIGEENYLALGDSTYSSMLGERFFGRAAYGLPPLGRGLDRLRSAYHTAWRENVSSCFIEWSELQRLEEVAGEWADAVAAVVSRCGFKVVGCTTMHQQTSASVALLNRIKRLRPDIATIIGGANCEGEMAQGIASLGAAIDYIFSGESEVTFPEFLRARLSGRPCDRIIHGRPCRDMDAIPTPSYGEFFEQLDTFFPDKVSPEHVRIPYETSRGCWWGQKYLCTFCGLNGLTPAFREKSAEHVLAELTTLVNAYPSYKISMVDLILPHSYFQTLVPRLPCELPNLFIYYDVKSNLSLKKVLALKAAGIVDIQPGIEALSSSLLGRMKKGVTAAQNIALLRYARSAQLYRVSWNLLYAFPGDRLGQYQETLTLLPLLHHLYPPTGAWPISLDRFSPYYDSPQEYGVTNIRPLDAYLAVFPQHANAAKLAYHFAADYQSDSREHLEIIQEIRREIAAWRAAWNSTRPPDLWVQALSDDTFLLQDTRGLPGTQEMQFLTRQEASVVLAGVRGSDKPKVEWALERKLLVDLDGACVPLATSDPELILKFERERRSAWEDEANRPVTPIHAGALRAKGSTR